MSRTGEIAIDPHRYWMMHALDLAERGRGLVEPNPLVGAVVVKHGNIVGKGWHREFGGDHAEVDALREARNAARGSTLYVNLEPCCHHGKTPPCVDAILEAGVSQVVAALGDPFPQVAGKGFDALRNKGVEITLGVCEPEARQLNAPFLRLVTEGRPHVHGKWAMTLDGKIATRTGDSKWISNRASRKHVHDLRGRVDAILVGSGTANTDNPKLTARPSGVRIATRVVLDSNLGLSPDSHLVRTATEIPTLVIGTRDAPNEQADTLEAAGCEILRLDAHDSRVPVSTILAEFGKRRWTNLLVEGGAEVLGSFLDADRIDEFHVFISPKLVGGRDATPALGGLGRSKINEALTLTRTEFEDCEGDIYLHGWRD